MEEAEGSASIVGAESDGERGLIRIPGQRDERRRRQGHVKRLTPVLAPFPQDRVETAVVAFDAQQLLAGRQRQRHQRDVERLAHVERDDDLLAAGREVDGEPVVGVGDAVVDEQRARTPVGRDEAERVVTLDHEAAAGGPYPAREGVVQRAPAAARPLVANHHAPDRAEALVAGRVHQPLVAARDGPCEERPDHLRGVGRGGRAGGRLRRSEQPDVAQHQRFGEIDDADGLDLSVPHGAPLKEEAAGLARLVAPAGTPRGQTRSFHPKPVPLVPGWLPDRPRCDVEDARSHGRGSAPRLPPHRLGDGGIRGTGPTCESGGHGARFRKLPLPQVVSAVPRRVPVHLEPAVAVGVRLPSP